MAKSSGALSGSRASAEPSSTVSALTGFDPARKDKVFSAQLALITRRNHLSNSIDAAGALRWLHDYGSGVLRGGTYGTDYGDANLAEPYLKKAREAFSQQMFDHAVSLALADMENGLATAVEPRAVDKDKLVERCKSNGGHIFRPRYFPLGPGAELSCERCGEGYDAAALRSHAQPK